MNALRRWVIGLLIYHAILTTVILLFGSVLPTTHWTGSLVVFGIPTVQFTWSMTIGMILGASRRNRPWYWSALLLSFIPLWFVRIACFLAFHFVGTSAAIFVGMVCGGVLIVETVAGVCCGIEANSNCRKG